MKLYFKGDVADVDEGINILSKELNFHITDDGIPISVMKTPGNISVAVHNQKGHIKYGEKIHFYRGLGLLVESLEQNESFEIIEEPQFTMNGAMFDVSANAVMKVESVKRMIRKMALMGLNMLMLYTEDTYTIKTLPYFGYMRGRYSYQELKECDDYAAVFGMEIIPCIQTLAHFANVLRWDYTKEISDTDDILLVGEEKTYLFIEDMIKAASAPFRSKRIHIGMDEAQNLGLGKYLDINGYRKKADILHEHVRKVFEITSRHGLRPMIWSDMYFTPGSNPEDYYNTECKLDDSVFEDTPKGLQLVYWDYFHTDESHYQKKIRQHKIFGSDPVFAGCVWTWTGFGTNYGKTFLTTKAALSACKKEGIKEVFTTIWMNNGVENNFFSTLLGLQLYAEHGYAKELDEVKLKKRFKACTGGDYEAFMGLKYLDEIPGTSEENLLASNSDGLHPANPSKYLLWQDLITGLFDRHMSYLNIADHYKHLESEMEEYSVRYKEWSSVFKVPQKLCSVLEIKSELGLKIKWDYDSGNLAGLRQITQEQLPELCTRINELRAAHREQWFEINKPFGWEVLDIRYGGLLSRIDTVMKRLLEYLDGRIDRIEELEEERLYYDGPAREMDTVFCFNWQYHRIVTTGKF